MAITKHKYLKRPHCPVWDDCGESLVLPDYAYFFGQLQFEIVAQQAGFFCFQIFLEGIKLGCRNIGKYCAGPDLAVRMRIARSHQFAAIFKNLYMTHPREFFQALKL